MFNEKLRHILNSKNISAKELSFNSGISQSHLSKLLNNKIQPRYDKIVKISEALHVSPSVFFELNNHSKLFGKTLNMKVAVIETEAMLADIYLNNEKTIFGFFLRYLKDYEDNLNKYDEIIGPKYQFLAFVREGEVTFKYPNGATKEFVIGDIITKEIDADGIRYFAKAGTFLTSIFMGSNMDVLWEYYTAKVGTVINQRNVE